MNGMNLQASVNNVPQMERHQNDQVRTPLVYHDQNSAIAKNLAERRMQMPTEAQNAEKNTIHTKKDASDQNDRQKKKKRSRTGHLTGENRTNEGYIVDVEA